VSVGVCCRAMLVASHAGMPSKPSPMEYEKPSCIVAGRGLMPCDVGVVHMPCGAAIGSDFGVSPAVIVMIGAG
jgi:hypothetical protein